MQLASRLLFPLVLYVAGCAERAELRLPDVRQATGYTCGASALQAVLAYYGIEAREDSLAKKLAADPDDGIAPEAIVRVATEAGLHPRMQEGLTLEALMRLIDHGSPVIVALQAWPDKPRKHFADDWDDGHYVVVIGRGHGRLIFEEPSLLGSRGTLTEAEFLDRWHDRNRVRSYVHLGISFEGRKPAPPPTQLPID